MHARVPDQAIWYLRNVRIMFCPASRAQWSTRSLAKRADVAQLVAHHLAKVRVAGSNPVIRSVRVDSPLVVWPSGEATACKAVHTGSIPVATSTTNFISRAISSVGERFPDTEEVTSSILVSRTTKNPPEPRRVFSVVMTLFACAFGVSANDRIWLRSTSRVAWSTRRACGCSAAGSASPCQGEGRGFESRHPLGAGQLA